MILIPLSSFSQNLLQTDGKAIVNQNQDTVLLRGMGLGGWMLQEGYMLQTAEFANAEYQIRQHIQDLIGQEKTDLFYNAWLANHVTKSDIDSLKSWGFNSVRLPMHYKLFTLPIEEEPEEDEHTWLDKGFILTDSLISWCKQNELYVILDLHGAPGGQGYDQGISDYDPTKPSLWESKKNRDKMVALWQRLAARYVDEDWVAGYDLLNEPNWDMNGNLPLANLYKEITDSIRTIDTRHIIFIEGNWFANDFTGLTPPWDDNLVYSPHKYWSHNDQASIQWVLDLRETYNVPLYLGESGENSNVWFRNGIHLLENQNIGWAWWPMKKIDAIAGPLSVKKTEEYEVLLDYWKGNGSKPDENYAFDALMQMAENLKIENCIYQKDVIDAMFRQVNSDDTKPFKNHSIPGTIYASDYDLGRNGIAYYDNNVANYHVSTGQYTAWNNGWAYRNDGVDIEPCMDNTLTNGYNVGWIEKDEWMKYSIEVTEDAVYDVQLRIAKEDNAASVRIKSGEANLSPAFPVPNTGGWQDWQTIIIPDVILGSHDNHFILYSENGNFNLSSFHFIAKASSSSMTTRFAGAQTTHSHQVSLFLNKTIQGPLASLNNFTITVNGIDVDILNYQLENTNTRIINFELTDPLLFSDVVRISYNGTDIIAHDGTPLSSFLKEPVINKLPIVYSIPGKIEMEDYCDQVGIQVENTEDIGGGLNIGFLDPDDYLDYKVYVEKDATYKLSYRIASEQNTGSCQLSLIDQNGQVDIIDNANFPSTGGWQSWQTVEEMVDMTAGYYTLRIKITNGPFNMNWIHFESLEENPLEEPDDLGVTIFPVPAANQLFFKADFAVLHNVDIKIHNHLGQRILDKHFGLGKSFDEEIDISQFSVGQYFITVILEDETRYQLRFIKI